MVAPHNKSLDASGREQVNFELRDSNFPIPFAPPRQPDVGVEKNFFGGARVEAQDQTY